MNTKVFYTVIALLIIAVTGFAYTSDSNIEQPKVHVNESGNVHNMTVYKSATCGCCANWVTYMRHKGYEVDVVDTDDMDSVKADHDIPQELHSCHTTIINDGQYFVEGHILEEAIVKLMEDEPKISGIGMPGMPSASPGMPGPKNGPFNISQVGIDGTITNYMSI